MAPFGLPFLVSREKRGKKAAKKGGFLKKRRAGHTFLTMAMELRTEASLGRSDSKSVALSCMGGDLGLSPPLWLALNGHQQENQHFGVP